jgi:hypothetical protein
MNAKTLMHTALHIGCVTLLLWQSYRIQQMQRTERLTVEAAARQILLDPQLRGHLFLAGLNGPSVGAGFSGSKLEKECWCYPWGQQNTDIPNSYFCTCGFGTAIK